MLELRHPSVKLQCFTYNDVISLHAIVTIKCFAEITIINAALSTSRYSVGVS